MFGFDNIDKKIMRLARALMWIGIAASIILGIFIMVGGIAGLGTVAGVLIGLLTIIVGSLASWAGNFVLYGFGYLIKLVERIQRNG